MLYAPSNVPAIFAFQGTLQQSSILAPVLLAIGAVETASFPGWEPTDFKMKDGYVPGSYANIEGLSPWTKDKLSAEDYRRKEVVELNNGRLATQKTDDIVEEDDMGGLDDEDDELLILISSE